MDSCTYTVWVQLYSGAGRNQKPWVHMRNKDNGVVDTRQGIMNQVGAVNCMLLFNLKKWYRVKQIISLASDQFQLKLNLNEITHFPF